MGYMRHHAIVVTSWKDELIEAAHAKAVGLGACVTEITPEVTNGYRSFLVAPDGSKEGWDASTAGDARRAELVAWLDEQRYSDGSTSIGWVEVQFDDDDDDTHIVRDSSERRRQLNPQI